jgi:hypothetical protein
MRDFNELNHPHPQFARSVRYLDFDRAVKQVAIDLVRLFERVPEWRPDWPVVTPAAEPLGPTRFPRL